MHAYLINNQDNKPFVIGRFDTKSAAESIVSRAAFPADVVTERSETLANYTVDQLVSLYNSVAQSGQVKSFKSKKIAIERLIRALHEADYRGKVVTKDSTTKDFAPLTQVGELRPVRKDSRIGKLVVAMQKGGTVEELAKAIDYPASKLWRDHAYSLQRKGYGREFRDGKFWLVLPDGISEPLIK